MKKKVIFFLPSRCGGAERVSATISKILSNDDCTLAIEVRPTYELDQLILSFGPDVEVLEPTEYREYIKGKIVENLQKYLPMQKDCTEDF